jgi:tRNA-splicing ligase RtcB
MYTISGKHGSALITIPLTDLETSCLGQICTFLDHPAFTAPIAIMPDTHAGAGAVIGFTMPLTDRVIPFVIGVDIGCGMISFPLGLEISRSYAELDQMIRARVPFGFYTHDRPIMNMERDFPWETLRRSGRQLAAKLAADYGIQVHAPRYDMDWFLSMCKRIGMDTGRAMCSLGTLGGGNHFIELGRSANTGELWATVHTGSRNLGKKVAEYWQNLAKRYSARERRALHRAEVVRIREETEDRTQIGRLIEESKARHGLKDKSVSGLEWLEGEKMAGYLLDMIFAQAYADFNRRLIAQVICDALGVELKDEVVSVHNFIDFKDGIIRKGAIRSYEGERMIIPFNMRDGVLICEGKSNAAWNFSAPHGAGRVMSRGKAFKTLEVGTFQEQMRGIYSTSVGQGTLDEAPDAYKKASFIEAAIAPTAKVVDRLVPAHNMKAKGRPRGNRRR